MGGGSWSDDAYEHIKTDYKSKSRDDIFSSKNMDDEMSPVGVKFRESRDSEEHPESLAIAVFLDVTGSMGRIPEVMVREKLGALMNTLISHEVEHPQIFFGAIGDQYSDDAPLQIGQFESETKLLDNWLTKIYLEGNGGGQNMESYLLAWLFAGRHTTIDCFEKREQKGFLFTIGDEMTWDSLTADNLKEIMGYKQSDELTAEQLLSEAQRTYHVFHIHINEASYRNDAQVFDSWKKLLGERFIVLEDHEAIGELIASTVAVIHGVDLKKVTSSFDKKTALLVENALTHIDGGEAVDKPATKDGVAEL